MKEVVVMIGKINDNLINMPAFGNKKPGAEKDPLYQSLDIAELEKSSQAEIPVPQNTGKPETDKLDIGKPDISNPGVSKPDINKQTSNLPVPNNSSYMPVQTYIAANNPPVSNNKKKDNAFDSILKSTWGKTLIFASLMLAAILIAKRHGGTVSKNTGSTSKSTSASTSTVLPEPKKCFEADNLEKKTVYSSCVNLFNRGKKLSSRTYHWAKDGVTGAASRVKNAVKRKPKIKGQPLSSKISP